MSRCPEEVKVNLNEETWELTSAVDPRDIRPGELDILGASAGVLYENVPRTCLKHHEVVDLLQVSEKQRETNESSREDRFFFTLQLAPGQTD